MKKKYSKPRAFPAPQVGRTGGGGQFFSHLFLCSKSLARERAMLQIFFATNNFATNILCYKVFCYKIFATNHFATNYDRLLQIRL